MSKLWIVHPRPTVREALARATGLPAGGIAVGPPALDAFAAAPDPVAVLMALAGDLETELAFARAVRQRTPRARWVLLCPPGETTVVRRRFDALAPGVLALPPDRARLRAEVASALAARSTDSLVEDDRRTQTAARFDAWLGDTALPGLARVLDPGLRRLPLLVRGRAGSGRSLLVQHAEQTRGRAQVLLRCDGRAPGGLEAIVSRVRRTTSGATHRGAALGTTDRIEAIWIDEIDALPLADQRALADWIAHGVAPAPIPSERLAPDLRWLATAGPADLTDRLDEALARTFVPLTIAVPPLPHTPEAIGRIAAGAARAWADATSTALRRFGDSALRALADAPLWGERAELDAVLRTSLAASEAAILEAADLRFPDTPAPDGTAPDALGPMRASPSEAAPIAGLEPLALDPEADPSSALLGLTGPWSDAQAAPDTPFDRASAPPPATDDDGAAPASSRPESTAPLEALEPLRPASVALAPEPGDTPADPTWRRLARSLSHEIRNPLVSIRTFTELLPDHYADETFRTRFKEFVGKDVGHIQQVVARLAKATERDRFASIPVDVSALIDRVLAAHRDAIAGRRLVVLSELERDAPFTLGDPEALETALDGLVDRAIASLPDRGDLFVTTRRLARTNDGPPRLRVLLRHHNPQATGLSGELDPVHQILEYVLAETIVGALGGRLTIDPTLGPETLIVIDLPTP
ncbi:MAG: histidine kinase dimerization/phospho-acceptor domain-containing protein [Myxococcota bacterium]